MARPKGTNKTGGRMKGTSNKRTSLLANELEERGFSFSDELLRVYANLDIDKKAYFLIKIMEFLYPKPVQKEPSGEETQSSGQQIIYKNERGVIVSESTFLQANGNSMKLILPLNGR